MKYRRNTALLLFIAVVVAMASAGDQNPTASAASPPPRISKQTRMELVKLVNAELVYVRSPFPMGRDGLQLKDGVVRPSGAELQQLMAVWGPAAKNGDAARITDVVFKDNYIHVEINGGPVRKQKWYQRISIGGASGSSVPIAPSDSNANARGSFVNVYFDSYIPEMTGHEFKEILRPVLDFDSKSPEEAYLETVPPKVKEAIQNHRVLVGMNHDMVTYAKGRPPKKVREHQDEIEFEEWIYGDPPQDVEFVRFIGDEVVRLEVMKVDGQKIVRTEKEIDLESATKVATEKGEPDRPASAPTLHRPGEEADTNDPVRATSPSSRPPAAPLPPPGQDPTSGPN